MIAAWTWFPLVGAIGLLLSLVWFFLELFRGRITLKIMREKKWPF